MEKITMLETRRGTQDGYRIELFESGKTYTVTDDLAYRFLKDRYAALGELNAEQLKESHKKADAHAATVRDLAKWMLK